MIIKEYYFTSAFEKESKWRRYTFAQVSYSRWAASTLIKELESHPKDPPLLVVEKFRDKMNEYSLLNRNTSYIFSVAYDVAQDIVDRLIT